MMMFCFALALPAVSSATDFEQIRYQLWKSTLFCPLVFKYFVYIVDSLAKLFTKIHAVGCNRGSATEPPADSRFENQPFTGSAKLLFFFVYLFWSPEVTTTNLNKSPPTHYYLLYMSKSNRTTTHHNIPHKLRKNCVCLRQWLLRYSALNKLQPE